MYYYKTFYEDGSWDIIKSTTRISSPKTVCKTCVKIQIISGFRYYLIDLIYKIKYFNK